jgi:hypothetical protein
MASATSGWNLGFLTVLQEPAGYQGGYLVTNQWGRPLEFRLSTPVQPNRVQQILYGDSLEPFLCADLIGKTLVDKTASPANFVVTDRQAALDLRYRVDVPVALLARVTPGTGESGGKAKEPFTLQVHPHFADDDRKLRELMDQLGGPFNMAEPFARIREAIAEARKMGVAGRG